MSESGTRRQALVTGGTRGIGAAVTLALADAGYAVTATGVGTDEVDAFRASLPAGLAVTAEPLDVTDAESVAGIAGRLGRLDVLVNSAGIILRGGAEFDPENFTRVLAVNLAGMMRVSVACRPLLVASRGCIVNVASMLSFFGSAYVPAYSASKGGVAQLTKSLALAWAADGVRVNAVAPGWVRTALTLPLQEDPARSRAILERTPLGRWGEPADVAGPILFLCSPAAAFVTGILLPVDGGYSAG